MALNGTLSDLGIIDLIQFPHTGRKTGELVIAGMEGEGRLYYQKGKLVHVVCSDHVGLDAMVDLVGWVEGEFEFRLGVETEEKTIELDLHRALMQALKLRDERAEEKRKTEEEPVAAKDALQKTMDDFIKANPIVQHALVASAGGKTVAQSHGSDGPDEGVTELTGPLSVLWEKYPRKELSRVFFDDGLGIAVAVKLSGASMILIISVSREVSLGMATVSAGKLAALLEEASG